MHTPGYHVLVVNSSGNVIECPGQTYFAARFPWELCWSDADQQLWREAFVQACMFRTRQEGIRVSLRVPHRGNNPTGDRCLEVISWLVPLSSGDVLVRMVRIAAKELSEQDRRVLRLVSAGESNSGIAHALGITESTVRTHLARMREKLGIDRSELLVAAAMGVELPDHFGD